MSLVSIIIPIYNREKLFYNTVQSIKRNSYKNYECIFVDDYSSDDTFNMLKSQLSDDANFSVIRNMRKKGAPGARNTGLDYSKGEYVVFFDSDNIMYFDYINKKVEKFRCQPELDVVTSFSHVIDNDGLIKDIFTWKTHDNIFESLIKGSTYVDTNSAMIRKSSLKDFYWDENVPSYQEWDFHLSLARKGLKYGMIWDFLTGYYRRLHGTISSDINRGYLGLLYVYLKWFEDFKVILGMSCFYDKILAIPLWHQKLDMLNKSFSFMKEREFIHFQQEIKKYSRVKKIRGYLKLVGNVIR